MSSFLGLDLETLDRDGAIQETFDALPGLDRRSFLVLAAAGTAGAAGAAALSPALADAKPFTGRDLDILRFDLVLEYLQAGMYTEAERLGALSATTLGWSREVGAHERAHVKAIKGILGRQAVPSPAFDYGEVTQDEHRFTATAVAFEDLTAALLKWQAVRVGSPGLVAALLSLHTVEARHAAWIRHTLGLPPATAAFDEPQPQARMAALIRRTNFIVAAPRTSRRGRPRFTG
jgi:hypothetical protein